MSIITPSYNQAAFLPATLRSVADQRYPRIEHIVLDGGSTDGSVEIIERWAETHPITWRSERDKGQADAIQRGIAMSTGAIVAWLNSDDIYLDPMVVSDVVDVFRRGSRFVTGGGWYLDEAGNRRDFIPVYPERIDSDTLKHVDWILQPATFVERALFLSCPIDTSLHYAFDWDLFIRIAEKVPPTPIFRELAGYTVHDTGKTVSGGARRQRELVEVTRRYQGRTSIGYLLLIPISAAYRLAERLPLPVGHRIVRGLQRFADLTHRLSHGRGIQF